MFYKGGLIVLNLYVVLIHDTCKSYYLYLGYSIAWDRLENHLRLSVCLSVCLCVCVCLSVVTPMVAILGQFRWNFAQSFGAQKRRSSSLGVKIQ